MTANQCKLAAYEAGNRAAATLVLQDPGRWGGETALMVMWARMVAANASADNADGRAVESPGLLFQTKPEPQEAAA